MVRIWPPDQVPTLFLAVKIVRAKSVGTLRSLTKNTRSTVSCTHHHAHKSGKVIHTGRFHDEKSTVQTQGACQERQRWKRYSDCNDAGCIRTLRCFGDVIHPTSGERRRHTAQEFGFNLAGVHARKDQRPGTATPFTWLSQKHG